MNDIMKKIWVSLDRVRGSAPINLSRSIEAIQTEGIELTPEILEMIIQKLPIGCGSESYFPLKLAQFIVALVKIYNQKSILFPWGRLGDLSIIISDTIASSNPHVIFKNTNDFEIFKLLSNSENIHAQLADPVEFLKESDDYYDTAIACPPFGLRRSGSRRFSEEITIDNNTSLLEDDIGNTVICRACEKLNDNGTGIFVVTPKFMLDVRDKCARNVLSSLGMKVSVCLEIPSGIFSPLTNISANLIVINRTTDNSLFTGRISFDKNHQEALFGNLKEKKEGIRASQGRLIEREEFRSFRVIEVKEQAEELANKMGGLQKVCFRDILLEINRSRQGRQVVELEDKNNCVYMASFLHSPAVTSQEDLSERTSNYFQLVFDPEKVNSTYVAGILNSNLGTHIRDIASNGSARSQISRQHLNNAPMYLPDIDVQEKIVAGLNKLKTLKSEINELESNIWKKPANIDNVVLSIEKINTEETFVDWLDKLPFPLASILWSYHTSEGSYKDRYERLLHFFEALTEFLATIHLSAFSSNPGIWVDMKTKIKEIFDKQSLSFELGTFGTWKVIVEFLSKKARKMLNSQNSEGGDESKSECFQLYKTQNYAVLKVLTAKGLIGIISEANECRNNWSGHTGIVSNKQAARVHEQLSYLVTSIRQIFGTFWEDYKLVLPKECKIKSGLFHYKAKSVMGSRTPFQTIAIELTEGMDDGNLHLLGEGEEKALKLLPLIKVMPSPRSEDNACYFYNRCENNGKIRFLSYYFESDSEVVDNFEDTALTLESLSTKRL